jgi:hypothetical protein
MCGRLIVIETDQRGREDEKKLTKTLAKLDKEASSCGDSARCLGPNCLARRALTRGTALTPRTSTPHFFLVCLLLAVGGLGRDSAKVVCFSHSLRAGQMRTACIILLVCCATVTLCNAFIDVSQHRNTPHETIQGSFSCRFAFLFL